MPDLLPHWRDHLKIHPAAELFPRMTDAELDVLGKDIKKNGLTSPIILWSPGYLGDGTKDRPVFVLDGISRLDAMERMGIRVVNKKGEPDELRVRFETAYATDPYEYVISANIHRRHLTLWQKCDLITTLLKADPSKSDRQIGAIVKTDHKTVGKVRREKERRGEIPHVEARTDTKGRQQPAPARKPKFTPECIEQIRSLVERGTPRDEIAEAIGTTVGALQVTCSKLGISLRKPIPRDDGEKKPDDTVTVRTLAVPVTRSTVKVASVGYVQDRGHIGPSSGGEVERLRARVSELENEKRVLETKIIGLESEVAELRARLPKDDPFDIPPLLRRH